jgi:hypothetical protein
MAKRRYFVHVRSSSAGGELEQLEQTQDKKKTSDRKPCIVHPHATNFQTHAFNASSLTPSPVWSLLVLVYNAADR